MAFPAIPDIVPAALPVVAAILETFGRKLDFILEGESRFSPTSDIEALVSVDPVFLYRLSTSGSSRPTAAVTTDQTQGWLGWSTDAQSASVAQNMCTVWNNVRLVVETVVEQINGLWVFSLNAREVMGT